MKRQKSDQKRLCIEKPASPKSLAARYAELLRLREAVSRTQSDLKLSSNAERTVAKENRALPYH